MQNKHDKAIDKTLAALTGATPPEGMEARIQQRLHYHAAAENASARRALPSLRGWWYGALTGAAAATLLCCVVLFAFHLRLGRTSERNVNQAHEFRAGSSKTLSPASLPRPRATPCVQPSLIQPTPRKAAPHVLRADAGRTDTHSPEDAAPKSSEGLTPQEQQLVRLTRTASPEQLADLSFEAQAQADQEEAAAFQKFFTPPPPPPHDEGVNE